MYRQTIDAKTLAGYERSLVSGDAGYALKPDPNNSRRLGDVKIFQRDRAGMSGKPYPLNLARDPMGEPLKTQEILDKYRESKRTSIPFDEQAVMQGLQPRATVLDVLPGGLREGTRMSRDDMPVYTDPSLPITLTRASSNAHLSGPTSPYELLQRRNTKLRRAPDAEKAILSGMRPQVFAAIESHIKKIRG